VNARTNNSDNNTQNMLLSDWSAASQAFSLTPNTKHNKHTVRHEV
jgi:hypothetical protein